MRNIHLILIYYLLSANSIYEYTVSAKKCKDRHRSTAKANSKKSKSSLQRHGIKSKSRKSNMGKAKVNGKSEKGQQLQTEKGDKRVVGTRITGAGHHNKRNRSIYKIAAEEYFFKGGPRSNIREPEPGTGQLLTIIGDMSLSKSMRRLGDVDESQNRISNDNATGYVHDIDRTHNPVRGRMYTRMTADGKLLFYFCDQKKAVSLAIKYPSDRIEDPREDPQIVSSYCGGGILDRNGEQNEVDLSSKEWIPIEGIYGIYMLPSGPHLVLITDSEEIYKINGPSKSNAGNTNMTSNGSVPQSLIDLRRILSMEIVRIPSIDGRKKQKHNEERRQFGLLRRSLKEHEFYYVTPVAAYEETNRDRSNVIVQDVTHTLQRSFVHWTSARECHDRRKNNDSLFVQANSHIDAHCVEGIEVLIPTPENPLNGTRKNATEVQKSSVNMDAPEVHLVDHNENETNQSTFDICDGNNENSVAAGSKSKSSWASSWFGLGSRSGSYDHDNEKKNDLDDKGEVEESIFSPECGYDKYVSWWYSMVNNEQKANNSKDQNESQRPDSRFFWNEECVKPILRTFETEDHSTMTPCQMILDHTIPVTSAFVGIQRNISLVPNATRGATFSVKYDQLLISRRSKYRAGTRFTKRGADSIGDVANFAETEQICAVINESEARGKPTVQEIYSHVQTRGSIPLRWSSPTDIKTYRPRVMIGTNPLAQARALRNHLIEQLSLYSPLTDGSNDENTNLAFINLIDKHSDQGRLGRTFDAVLTAVLKTYKDDWRSNEGLRPSLLNPNSVSHIWFDFHAACKKGRWDRLSYLLDEVRPCLDRHGYFCAIPAKESIWSIIQLQNGVVRTNCMDCLDRTNVVQSMFGRYILFHHFSDRFGLKATPKRNLPLGYSFAFKREMLTLPWNSGEVAHRMLWADNADSISRLYAGTNALKGDFTRTGKRTKRGALDDGVNSLTRFYLNNFLDADRQEGMDLLTGYVKFDNTQNSPGYIRSSRNSKKRFRNFFQREKVNAAKLGSHLSLNWLPGDLQSHLRCASVSSATHQNDAMFLVPESSGVSLSLALKDIDRRAMLEDPWWVMETVDEIKQTRITEKNVLLKQQIMGARSSSTGYILGALIASLKAPMTTAVAYICFMVPGLFVD